MLPLQFGHARKDQGTLCLGAHSDDIGIGCGGTILARRGQSRPRVTWVVFSGDAKREPGRRAARRFPTAGSAGSSSEAARWLLPARRRKSRSSSRSSAHVLARPCLHALRNDRHRTIARSPTSPGTHSEYSCSKIPIRRRPGHPERSCLSAGRRRAARSSISLHLQEPTVSTGSRRICSSG